MSHTNENNYGKAGLNPGLHKSQDIKHPITPAGRIAYGARRDTKTLIIRGSSTMIGRQGEQRDMISEWPVYKCLP